MGGFSRRQLLRATAASVAAGLLPRRVLGAPAGAERKFLFVFCSGGWDTTYAFTDAFDNPLVDMPENSAAEVVGGVPIIDSEERPSVRAFMEEWGDRTALIHGLELHSVAHTACLQHIMTGTLHGRTYDWATLLAGQAQGSPVMPLIHLSGPAFSHDRFDVAVRVGEAGQLAQLMSGAALGQADLPISPPAPEIEALEDSFMAERVADWAAEAGRGRAQAIAAQAVDAAERRERLEALSAEIDIASGSSLPERAAIIASLLEQDMSRCGMVQHDGWGDFGWDTHGGNELQSEHFEDLFSGLSEIMVDLAARSGSAGGSLLDETTVVVLSEMNRYPRLNGRGGKEHWTFTSAVLIGAGVVGGQAVGGYTDGFTGERVDLDTGGVDADGVTLGPADLGATLCAIADLDPAEHVPEGRVIRSLVSGS